MILAGRKEGEREEVKGGEGAG